ncbi:hypothetical protein [Corallococcus exercitus]|uniref:Uncharacterized protein n=1 Tax=Corallococcus exercitus TaxID=2316736 RepID=A0A7Y4JXY1_9BACT|nr:hypothetical protein [Corallococcus exercitus]NOK12843.1 hypothetical protein [Corallococcus exercitus]
MENTCSPRSVQAQNLANVEPVDVGVSHPGLYGQAPDGLVLELATAEGAFDTKQWISPAMVIFRCLSTPELAGFVRPVLPDPRQ